MQQNGWEYGPGSERPESSTQPLPAGPPHGDGQQQYGQPIPPPPSTSRARWSGRTTAAVAAVAVALAVTGGVAYAASRDGSTPANSANRGPGGFGPNGFDPQNGYGAQGGTMPDQGSSPDGGRPAAGPGLPGALHGDFVVADPNGGYSTRRLQVGKITDVSSTSVTVVSDDGYSSTYAINSSTKVNGGSGKVSDLSKGQTVRVLGSVDNGKATALSISTRGGDSPGDFGDRRGGFGRPDRDGMGGEPGQGMQPGEAPPHTT